MTSLPLTCAGFLCRAWGRALRRAAVITAVRTFDFSVSVIRSTLPDLNLKLWLSFCPATVRVKGPAQVLPLAVLPRVALQVNDPVTLPFLLSFTVFGVV